MKKTQSTAFTLIELLIVIAIISIFGLGITQLNFNTISDKQKLDTLITQVVSNFETVRNNALLGKGIGTDLRVPESYQIDYSTTGSGNIQTQYLSGTLEQYNDLTPISFGSNFDELYNIRCLDLEENPGSITSSTGTVIITGGTLSLTGACSDSSSKILELTFKRKELTETIQINTLTGLVKK